MQLTTEQVAPFIGGKITVTQKGRSYFPNKSIAEIYVERGFLRVRSEDSSELNYEAFLQLFVITEQKEEKLSMESRVMGEEIVLSAD